jgi:hypothetical protein
MDRDYDTEELPRLIREDLDAESIIPLRSSNNEVIGGKNHQIMARFFDVGKYGRHQFVENRSSVLKRKFSDDLKARKFPIQMTEIANTMIVCNIHTSLLFLIIELFYRAAISYSFFQKNRNMGDFGLREVA